MGSSIFVCRRRSPASLNLIVRRHEGDEFPLVFVGRRARRGNCAGRAAVGPLDAHFVGRIRITSLGVAVV